MGASETIRRPLQEQWELLFQATSRGIAVTDPRTMLLEAVNPAYAAMHGGTVDDFVGTPVARLLAPGSAARLPDLAARLEGGGLVAYESEHVRADGTVFPAAVEVMATRDAGGGEPHWLAWVEDLTKRRQAEREIARHADELARSNADLDRFAGVVAHDLRSPLRVIAGCARILERRLGEQLRPEDQELLEHLVGSVHRMSALLDGIRDYSRVRGDGRRELIALDEVLGEALAALEADLEGAPVEAAPLPVVVADRVQVSQLLQNLIGNALKFRGEAAPRIVIGARARGPMWQITVCDNGIGIEPEMSERVFEFGGRLHGEDRFPGTGMGLALAKTVVERHGGRIWVESEPERGATFFFTLPDGGSHHSA